MQEVNGLGIDWYLASRHALSEQKGSSARALCCCICCKWRLHVSTHLLNVLAHHRAGFSY